MIIRSFRPNPTIGAILALFLLFMQVTGLHQHRHVEASGASHDYGTQIHFEDAGIHADDPEHAHAGGAAGVSHGHADVEVKALESGLTKPALDFNFVALLAWTLVLCLPSRMGQAPPCPQAPPTRRLSRFAILPHSHAPPLTRAIAV
ncbi:MAG: hypothetical protein ACLGHI_04020 [Gammaproteobacteria bacterium]